MTSADSITNHALHEALLGLSYDLTAAAWPLRRTGGRGVIAVPDDAPVWDAIAEARNRLSELLARRLDAPSGEEER